ncbi:hypothetical protein [Thiolapillus sp.]
MIHHLLVPGLLEPPPTVSESPVVLRVPALELLLSRGEEKPVADNLEAVLFNLFQLDDQAAAAPFCWLADSGEEAEGWVMQATPVYLRADRDQLLLFELDEAQLLQEDAQAYATVFNEHFSEEGLVLKVASPSRWYLFTEKTVQAKFSRFSDVAGRSVGAFMPRGKDAAYWASIINETQMLFFQLAENRAGESPVSGLWFSGAGTLPSERPVAPALTEGDNCLLTGLVKHAREKDEGQAVHFINGIAQARRRLDAGGWHQALNDLDKRIRSLMGDAEALYLYVGSGKAYYWTKGMKYRVWRTKQRFRNILAEMENREQV